MPDVLGYARVSTTAQVLDLQTEALTAAGCVRVYSDTASGANSSRRELDHVLDRVERGDTLVIWKLDRLGRPVRHLLDLVADLDERGIGLRSLTEGLDTPTPGRRLVLHVVAALAEFERDVLRERTTAGLQAARARGRHGGRPRAVTDEQLRHARALLATDPPPSMAAVARTIGVARPTLIRRLASA